jgi:2,4-dienoyl-CoA reductase-like NADH-dependent reductase (Old Yellow Enzyme family)
MSYLLNPLQVGSLTLKNRLVMPPMATAKAGPEGNVSSAILEYYKEKSAGGHLSFIIIEHSFIEQAGKAHANQLSVADDSVIDGLKELAAVIHRNGTKTVMQINHAGSAANKAVTGVTPVGPSAVKHPRVDGVPHELTRQEIGEIVAAFGAAARRVKEAGFDGVEIHSAHGYFLNQFFSPLTNRRTDEYGGDVLGRIRIHLQVIEAVRAAVGQEFLLLLRLGASDYTDGGTTVTDSQVAAKEFEKAGVDIIDISGSFTGYTNPGNNDQGYFAPLSAAVKEAVSIPVILTGGITEAQAAERLLAQGKADLIGVGRAILQDSLWAQKAVDSIS